MNNNANALKDTRLLEALEFIDDSYVADVFACIKAPDVTAAPASGKGKILRSLKYVAAVAACALLMSTLIPVVQYVSGNLGDLFAGMFGPPSDTSELTEDSYKIPEEHIENAPYFIFSPDLEPISAEKMEEIRKAFYQMIYDFEYQNEYEYVMKSALFNTNEELTVKHCTLFAEDNAEKYASVVFSDNTEDHNVGRYYGTLEGYVFLMLNTSLPDEYNVMKLGNVTINNPTSFYIYGYKNGEFINLEELEEESEVSESTIVRLSERHNKFNSMWKDPEISKVEYYYPKFTPDLEILSQEQLNEIGNYFYKEFLNNESWILDAYEGSLERYGTEDDRIVKERIARGTLIDAESQMNIYFKKESEASNRYYGAFGENIILAAIGWNSIVTEFEIAGYRFYFPTAADIKVLNNGRMISLIQAYNEGLLTDEDIGVIHKRHDLYEKYLKNKK